MHPGRPIGSCEDWTEWCRDPLVALGCRDPIECIDRIKADNPNRRQIVELMSSCCNRSPGPGRETSNAMLVSANQQPSPGFKLVQHVLPARVPRPQDGTRLPEPRRNRLPVVRPVVLSMHAESGSINSGDRVFGHAP
jgi:hypothetical protein